MRCKKHPKYKAIRYPTSECALCIQQWDLKQSSERMMDDAERKNTKKLTEKRLDPPCDARAYAERHDFGNHDPERI